MDEGWRRPGDDVWAASTADASPLPAIPPARELAVRGAHGQVSIGQAVFGIVSVVADLLTELVDPHTGGARQVRDVTLGTAWQGYRATATAVTAVASAVSPAARLLADPPLVPRSLRPRTWASSAAARWRAERPDAVRSAAAARDVVIPAVVDGVLAPVDLTRLVLDRVDLAAVVQSALARVNLTDVVVQQVDLADVVDAALQPLDLTAIVIDRVDLAAVVEAALNHLDLTSLVKERVDLALVVDSALDQMDLTALVRQRVDLIGIAEEVIDAVDLPEIIRQSTGSVASETVRGIRMQSIGADESVQRMVDRVILWRKGRRTAAPGEPDGYNAPEPGGSGPDEGPQ